MGYESKIYVCNKHDIKEDGYFWAEDVAMFDMCKCPAIRDVFRKDSECFIYSDDGNTHIVDDMYGDPLKEASLHDVIVKLHYIIGTGDEYRRLKPCLAMLEGFNESQWQNLVCLHFGY